MYGWARRSTSDVAILAQLAQVHDADAVADVLDDREVVGDEDERQAVAPLQVLEQVQHLRLHAHVEGDGLVADDQPRLENEGAGDRDALALPTRELVRTAVCGDVGVEADVLEHLAHIRSALVPSFQMFSGSSTMSRTLRLGFSDEIGSWKIIWMFVRTVRMSLPWSVVSSCPWKLMEPLVGRGSCMIARPVVDLPHPDSPTRPSVSPARTSRLMPTPRSP